MRVQLMHVCLFAGNLKPISRMAPNGERKPKEKKIYIYKHHREKRHTRNDWINHNKYTNIWYSMRLHSLCNSSKIGNFNSVSKTVFDAIETNLFSKFLKIFHSSISCRLLNIPPNLGSKSNYFERFYFFFDFMFGATYHLAQMDSVKRAHISRWIEKLFSVSICLNFKSIYMLFGMKNESKKS